MDRLELQITPSSLDVYCSLLTKEFHIWTSLKNSNYEMMLPYCWKPLIGTFHYDDYFGFMYLQIHTRFIFCFSRNISPDEEDMIEKICNELRQDSQKVDFDISNFSAGAKYILYEEIRTRCPHFSSMPNFLYKVSIISFSFFVKDEE